MNSFLSLIFLSNILFLNSLPINDSKNPMLGDLFEGDIAGVRIISNDTKGYAQLETNSYGLWTNGIVPYRIDDYVYTQAQLDTIYEAMKLIETQTRRNNRDCIKFVLRSSESTWLRLHSGQGCWSYVGRQKWNGEQLASFQAPSCVYKGIIAHELIHALGFWHEQSRSDRDNYVSVNWNNIQTGQEHNFNKYGANEATTQGFPYDYYSIMHYEWDAFSKNGQSTIVPKQSGVNLIPAWQKYSLSATDIDEIRKYYNCV